MGIRGEHWITEDGDLLEADGDIGDYNHERHVIEMVASQIADEVGFPSQYDEIDPEELTNYIEENDLQEQITDADALKCLYGMIDARTYAMQKWGWKIVRDHDIETWTMTPNDLKIIADGLQEVLWQAGEDEEPVEELEFNVFAHATGMSNSYTLAQLEAGGLTTGMQLPSQTDIARVNTGWNNIAANQLADIDKQNMNPYYQQKTFPFGDSIISFRQFITENR